MESARVRALHEITGWEWLRVITGGVVRGLILAALGLTMMRGLLWLVTGY